jgi:2,3-bisphosphoglycerate-dependent phosphoglycerate mutase
MTNIIFVRHAQPDDSWEDDRTRPLTALGIADRAYVTETLERFKIHALYSSPYKRSKDTISDYAHKYKMDIHTDERFRERKHGIKNGSFLEERWNDFNFCEENGENLKSVQNRNIEALNEVLDRHPDQSIVIGSHGTALSTILNFYDPTFLCDGFKRIWLSMPYVIRLGFNGKILLDSEELLKLDRGY